MTKEVTVNHLMCVQRVVKERLNDLKTVRGDVSKKERYYSSTEKTIEPLYDVKRVDAQIINIQNWLLRADSVIKQSNAVTLVAVDIDLDNLLRALD
jgi:hypothetical protein